MGRWRPNSGRLRGRCGWSWSTKVLKGGDFEKRLVSRTADGLAIRRSLWARDTAPGAAPAARRTLFPWRMGHPPAAYRGRCKGRQRGDPRGSRRRRDLAACRSRRPAGRAVLWGRGALRGADGVFLAAAPVACGAGEYTADAAGSLMEIWRRRGIEHRAAAPFTMIRSACWRATGALYYPADGLRGRRQLGRKPACRA